MAFGSRHLNRAPAGIGASGYPLGSQKTTAAGAPPLCGAAVVCNLRNLAACMSLHSMASEKVCISGGHWFWCL